MRHNIGLAHCPPNQRHRDEANARNKTPVHRHTVNSDSQNHEAGNTVAARWARTTGGKHGKPPVRNAPTSDHFENARMLHMGSPRRKRNAAATRRSLDLEPSWKRITCA